MLGGGAIGCTVGGLIALGSRLKVGIIGRHECASAIRSHGLTLINKDTPGANLFIEPGQNFRIYSDINPETSFHLNRNAIIMIAVKSPDYENVVREYFPRIVDGNGECSLNDQKILLFQTGVDTETRFAGVLHSNSYGDLSERVMGVIVHGMAHVMKSDHPEIKFHNSETVIGAWGMSGAKKHLVNETVKLLKSSRKSTNPLRAAANQDKYRQLRYERAIIHSANSIFALFRVKPLEAMDCMFLRHYLERKYSEAIDVHTALTGQSQFKFMELLSHAVAFFEDAFQDEYTSLSRDCFDSIDSPDHHIRTEISEIDSYFASEADRHGINAEYSAFFGSLLRNFTSRFNEIRGESVDLAQEFGRKFIDWNRMAVGLEPHYDMADDVPVLKKIRLADAREDRLDVLEEIYTVLADRYSPQRSV